MKLETKAFGGDYWAEDVNCPSYGHEHKRRRILKRRLHSVMRAEGKKQSRDALTGVALR